VAAEEEEEEDSGPPAWLDDVNPDSMEITTHMFDESVFAFADKPFTRFQMERVGYYVVDPDSTIEKPIFNRTLGLRERADKKRVGAKNGGAAGAKAGPAAGPSAWTKTEIKVGQIVKAWEHPDSEKLWCEEIDVGEGQPRQIASGLREFYPDVSQMTGRRCLVVTNLKPAKLGGFSSCGMVLCAGNADHTKVEFVDVPAGAAIGERVFVEGESGDPVGAGNMKKKKIFAALAKDLKTSDACVAQWKGKAIMTSAGPCTVPSLGGVFIK